MDQENNLQCECGKWASPKNIFIFISVILLAGIIVVSILRERIVDKSDDITTVIGRGKIVYQPDVAMVTLGIQVDQAGKAEEALNRLNDSMNKVIESVKALGIQGEDIQTQTYSLFPHYEYQPERGNSNPSGYDANQQVSIKVRNVDKNPDLAGKVIEEAGKVGANQVVGVSFDVSNLEDLKQKARLEAIGDAKSKSNGLAKAAGVGNLGKPVSWYENIIKSPDNSQSSLYGIGGSDKASSSSAIPQISGGLQEIIIEIGLNYRIR